ncbi:hypothetical protein FE88_08195 [Azospirillum brasilense]|uniref:hypothetical protein n=1 Tax=Azospirillum phage Cd TaxID=467481 RepID=UPI000165BD77|nr:hypothetical protein APCd_gp74 [Azospirillum phage Cd]OPH16806.1 hypothetical protein FE89_02265 [Azospirillum brasilense]OPH21645.1 hypothetical protein FE88_08195 [Azospirillum brasilense]PWC93073.1 hypothetical protein AEJ54_14250 [Azospirillum sp. Sp 7]CAO99400.1 hypothetical protein [Azospirillum phage Cd]
MLGNSRPKALGRRQPLFEIGYLPIDPGDDVAGWHDGQAIHIDVPARLVGGEDAGLRQVVGVALGLRSKPSAMPGDEVRSILDPLAGDGHGLGPRQAGPLLHADALTHSRLHALPMPGIRFAAFRPERSLQRMTIHSLNRSSCLCRHNRPAQAGPC